MKRLFHRLFYPFYMLGYSIWLKTGRKLYYTDFIKWCELPQNRSSYPYFYGWLTRKSYCKGKPTRKIDWTNGLAIEKKNIA